MLAAPTAAQSVGDVRRRLAHQFHAAGIDTAGLDARVLVGHALGLDHTGLALQAGRILHESELDAVEALARRRLIHEPVARIVGVKEFWGLALALNAETLVPRPDSETVVEAALVAVSSKTRPLRIADLGTGSGALLLALLSELPAAHGIGTDVSVPALTCARANAIAVGLQDRAAFVACDQGTALVGLGFDLVVANPPYIRAGDIATLAPEVRDFDPRRALDGGADGFDAYRAIADDARRMLAAEGALVVEIGAGQAETVTSIFAGAGLALAAEPKADLAGVPRALTVKALP